MMIFRTPHGIFITHGKYSGLLTNFETSLESMVRDNTYHEAYRLAIELAKQCINMKNIMSVVSHANPDFGEMMMVKSVDRRL